MSLGSVRVRLCLALYIVAIVEVGSFRFCERDHFTVYLFLRLRFPFAVLVLVVTFCGISLGGWRASFSSLAFARHFPNFFTDLNKIRLRKLLHLLFYRTRTSGCFLIIAIMDTPCASGAATVFFEFNICILF